MYKVHVHGTRTVIDASRRAGIRRMVLASTSGTVAVSRDPEHVAVETDETPIALLQRWPYYRAKLFAERAALEASDAELAIISVNPTLLLGPGDLRRDPRFDDVRLYLERRIPFIPSGGIGFVDVRDAANAMILALANGRAGERYLINAVNLTLRAFFSRLERVSGVRGPWLPTPSSPDLAALRNESLPCDREAARNAFCRSGQCGSGAAFLVRRCVAGGARARVEVARSCGDPGRHGGGSARTRRGVARGQKQPRWRPRVMTGRPLLIANPRAGGGAAGRQLAAIVATTERSLGPVDVVTTQHGGHAIALGRACYARRSQGRSSRSVEMEPFTRSPMASSLSSRRNEHMFIWASLVKAPEAILRGRSASSTGSIAISRRSRANKPASSTSAASRTRWRTAAAARVFSSTS